MTETATPITPQSRSAALNAAALAKEQTIERLRAEHMQLINELANDPTSDALMQRIAATETELSRANAAVETLRLAAEAAEATERAEADAARREATKERRAKTVQRVRERQRLAERVDAAAEAFIDALTAWREEGRSIADDAHAVLLALHADEPARLNMGGQVLPHAHGTQGVFSAALADTIKRAVSVFGVNAMDNWLVVNQFAPVNGSFATANELSIEAVKSRL